MPTLRRSVALMYIFWLVCYRLFNLLLTAEDSIGEEALRMFLEDRQLHGDFVTKVSDMVWRRNGANVGAAEATTGQGSAIDVAQPEDVSSANHHACVFDSNNRD
jgi:hypothetical protein